MDVTETPFNSFVLRQAQTAGFFLGQLPDPKTGQKVIRKEAAAQVIQDLKMFEKKCENNLTNEEETLLTSAISNLVKLLEKVESTSTN